MFATLSSFFLPPAAETKPRLQQAGPKQMLPVRDALYFLGSSSGVEFSRRRGEYKRKICDERHLNLFHMLLGAKYAVKSS